MGIHHSSVHFVGRNVFADLLRKWAFRIRILHPLDLLANIHLATLVLDGSARVVACSDICISDSRLVALECLLSLDGCECSPFFKINIESAIWTLDKNFIVWKTRNLGRENP